jgi:ABC-type branched-subunit amino acid transport system ATPase component
VLLEVSHVGKSFGGIHALSGVTLQITAGRIQRQIGPNGTGKARAEKLSKQRLSEIDKKAVATRECLADGTSAANW